MKTFKVSDEVYEQLKGFVTDPFDDTPEVVIGRLIEIANKAKDRWSPFEIHESRNAERAASRSKTEESPEPEPVVVL
jgi:predicted CopG family antitoxin